MQLSNKQKVWELQRSIETKVTAPLDYIHPNRYKQHNVNVGDGLAPILALHAMLPSDTTRANPLRAIQDENLVAVHMEYDLWGPKAAFDIHRFEDGLIVEHWDNLQEMPLAANASGRTMFDGERTVTDFNKTAENKALIARFMNEVTIGRLKGQAATYFTDDLLLQHNPMIADGVEIFLRYVGATGEEESRVQYDRLHLLLGEGNFVLAVSEGHSAGKLSALYDLFRIEDEKIVEHWDVVEEIPPQSEWKNGNGKF